MTWRLTTNGTLLSRMAGELSAAGLHRVTVSLDSMDEQVFSKMSGGRGSLGQVLEGIQAAADAGLGIKINTVVQRGINDHTLAGPAGAFSWQWTHCSLH